MNRTKTGSQSFFQIFQGIFSLTKGFNHFKIKKKLRIILVFIILRREMELNELLKELK
jgi:hypothetical protein